MGKTFTKRKNHIRELASNGNLVFYAKEKHKILWIKSIIERSIAPI